MAEKLPVPNITIDENSTDYAVKMQQIADGQKTSIEAFNAQIDAGILAEEATSKIVQEKATATAEIDNTVATAKVDIAVAQNSIEKAKKDVVSVLTGGTATLEPEAGKIPLADADGVIDSKWIPASLTGQNAFAIKRDSNKDKYAASGMVHMGKHGSFSINEGLYVSNTVPNAVLLGRYDSNNPSGASKSDVAVAVIAGIETTLDRLNVNGNYHAATIKLPDAPDGTVTLNRETGAVTQHASAAEAFGGIVSNGDFRHGTDNWNFLNASMVIGSDGWATITTTAGYGRAAINMPTVLGKEYRLEAVIENTGDDLLLELAGAGIILTKNHLDAGIQTVTYHFTADAAVTTLRCQVQEGVGGSIRVNFVSVMPVAEEVVTERVDMYGLEAFLEEITVENPFVYPNGLIQSQAATMDGVATAFSNRPMTYYAAFDGDISSPGKGVNWFASNDIDKGTLRDNPKNEIHWIEGKLYQWKIRQKTFVGAGNGDWYNIDTTIAQTLTSTNNPLNRVAPQGGLDEPPAAGGNNYFSAYGNSNYNELPEKGLFTARNGAVGAFGHCYFLVMGTVPRLNQGAFFHGLNDFGARPFRFSQSNPTFLGPWNTAGINIFSKAQCFDLKSSSDAGNGALGASDYGGKIGTVSGRSDGRFYDAIYSGGLGGVIDYRLSAWDKSSAEEAAKVDVKVKSGAYRGVEKLRRAKVKQISVANSQSGNFLWTGTSNTGQDANSGFISLGMPAADAKLTPGTRIHAISGIVTYSGYVGEWQYNSIGNHYVRVIFDDWASSQTVIASNTNTFIVIEENTNISVSGNFLKTDILADPANIFTSSQLSFKWS
jgi:hypothetical protein